MSAAAVSTTAPFISEFLAVNDSGIRDRDGQRADWIELYNPTAGDINLDGYFLTDESALLNKWRFPAVTLASGGFLTVFASGKDRAVAGEELHTNFLLDSAGEYLALVAPNGATVLSDYGAAYPAQVADISYGVSVNQSTTSLIGPRATARALVPTNDTLGQAWTQHGFIDTAWTGGTTGVGYEREAPVVPPPGFSVRMVDVDPGTDGDISHVGEAVAILDSADGTAGGSFTVQSDTTVTSQVINMGPGGQFNPNAVLPNGVTETELYALRARARVVIPAGQWTINVNSDDGFRLTIPGVTFITPNNGEIVNGDTFQFQGLRGAADSFATFTVPEAGLTSILQLDFFENFGGDSVELSVASGHRPSFDTTNFALLGNTVRGWQVGDPAASVGINYRSLIGIDVEAGAFNKNASAYVRVPFSVQNANDFGSLRLRMKYDDGFVAYVNGVEVARSNAPSALPWNAQATGNRDENLAITYESFAVPPGVLRTGSNVLAIHALNTTANSSDMLVYPELQGFVIQLNNEARYLATPTPGAHNSATAGEGVVLDTKFSVDRGFFDAPIQLEITTATAGAQIRYTTNGQAPTATTGTVYGGPVTIDKTTTLRAAAFKPNFISSNVDTQTYLFLDDVVRQSPTATPAPGWPAANTRVNNQIINYGMDPDIVNSPTWGPQLENALKALPSFSIVTDAAHLFNPQTGIYVNPGGDGRPWERPASVELINPDGTRGFQIDAGLRLRGGFSRSTDNPKHAWRLFFRNEYDGSLKYPMFGPDGANSFDGFDLRTTQNYSWAFGGDRGSIFMRDQFSRDTQLAMGQPAERGDWYHLYINGQYWGLYNTDERPEANYGASYFGGKAEDYDVIKVDPDLGYNIEATDGNMDAWTQLYQLLRGAGPGTVTEEVYQQVQGNNPDGTPNGALPVLLDVDNMIDYMLVIYYGGNLDAPISNFLGNTSPNNFFALRNRVLEARQGFSFYAHDAEHSLLDVNSNRLGPSTGQGYEAGNNGLGKSNPQYFFQQLWHLPGFKLRVADHVQKHMVNAGGALTPTAARERLLARKAEIELATVAESARWGDSKTEPPITRNDFNSAFTNVLNNFIPGRTGVLISQLRQWGIIPAFHGPTFSPAGGQVTAGTTVRITNGAGTPAGSTIYYTTDGTDPRLPNGQLSPAAQVYTAPITINDTVRIRARTRTGAAAWSAINEATYSLDVGSLRVTEVMYNPAPAPAGSPFVKDDFEFVEVTNTGGGEIDLLDVKLDSAVDFTFPANFKLAAGGRAVVVKNRAAFESRYGVGTANIAGQYTNSLSDNGELVRLVSAAGRVVHSFTYSDGWYPQTDGEGYSLTAADPAAPAATWNLKAGWRPSGPLNGTPGAGDNSPNPGAVIVNEILANPTAGTGDFVELRNTTAGDVNIGGWYFSDDEANLKRFRLPAGTTVPANGYLVLNAAALGYDVSPAGGEFFLTSADGASNLGGYRESVTFLASEPGFSFGEYVKGTGGTDFTPLVSPTPGAANAAPVVGPVVINEVMYHPGTGRTEYIELRNLSGSPILLNDPANPTGAWKFGDGIDYVLPEGATIPAFGYALIVPVEPSIFRQVYNLPPAAAVYGPYERADGSNTLNNTGENIALLRPLAAGYGLADRLNYDVVAPWPSGAGGTGVSIARGVAWTYGNEAANWADEQVGGTPGRLNLDLGSPLVEVVDVSPDPRTSPVNDIRIVFDEPVDGVDLADLRLVRDGGANVLTGAQTLTTDDNITWTLGNLAGVTTAAGSYTLTLTGAGSGVVDWGGNELQTNASDTWRMGTPPSGRVLNRQIFYNNSRFDGGQDGAANDAAIAPDKQALLPGGTATFANYTSFSRGINGVMIEMTPMSETLTAADFVIQVGNDGDVGAWTAGPAPTSVTQRRVVGVGQTDRVALTWADGAIKNQWVRITVLANSRTRLAAPDVFYFGNLCGETGNNPDAAAVTSTDLAMIRRAFTGGKPTAPVTSRYDLNRDGKVDSIDLTLARRGAAGGSLTLFTAPGGAGAASIAAVPSRPSGAVFSQSLIAPQPAAGTGGAGETATGSVLGVAQSGVLGSA